MIDINKEAVKIDKIGQYAKADEIQHILRKELVYVDKVHQYYAIRGIGAKLINGTNHSVVMTGDEKCANELVELINKVFPSNKLDFIIDCECTEDTLKQGIYKDCLLLYCKWR